MLLTLTTTRSPATDLGWLLHKHPAKVQSFELAFGRAHVFYAEANAQRCTAALLLDVDPVGLVRRRGGPAGEGFSLRQYVNDRPYVASSFMSVAIAQVFGSALGGRCKDRPELAEEVLPLEARIAVLPCRGGDAFLRRLFEPLGYAVEVQRHALDPKFVDWGESPYFTVTLRGNQRLCDLLTHLYVLIPVLDNDKHYWVGDDEVDKLLRRGAGWLASHPERDAITRRYLKHQWSLAREALTRLAEEDHPDPDEELLEHALQEAALEASICCSEAPTSNVAQPPSAVPPSGVTRDGDASPDSFTAEATLSDGAESAPTLNSQRLATVLAVLRGCGATSVLDVGCGEGRLLRLLLEDMVDEPRASARAAATRTPRFQRIVGMDVSLRSLKAAAERLRLDRMPPLKRARIELIHGSLMYRDGRLRIDAATPFDAATCVEVIEHLDPPRLAAFERVIFEFAHPRVVIVTTPNREYNVKWESLPAGQFRHRDHRFEWTRAECENWARRVAGRFGYAVRFLPIGPQDAVVGAPTQMGVFQR
ncbi:MAG: hypothetical protein CHACPFDD_00315 [Phycisphaerae bacterium]|nr:hypothetical protein [Phycisphaerae bacterium]